MKHLRFVLVFVLFSVFLIQSANSQVFYLNEDHVKPSKVEDYEAALKAYVDFLSANNYPFSFEILKSSDLVYYLYTPMRSTYADLDSISNALGRTIAKDTLGWNKMFSKFNDTYYFNKASCYYFAANLSYTPNEPAIEEDEMTYQEVWFIQIKLGTAGKVNSLLKEYVDLCVEKGVRNPMFVYRGLIGMNQGTYIITSPAKNPGDLWQSEQETYELLGEGGKEISSQIMKFIDKMEVKQLWWLKKYSYTPKK